VICAACQEPLTDGAEVCERCGQPIVDPLIGKLLGERYRLDAVLGRGGMGVVYRGEHVLMKKEVAVKVLHAELGALDEVAKRFEREAQSASRLAHPNIISVTDFGRADGGTLFLVMEVLHGEPLTALIERGPIAPPRAAALLTQILQALEHAHAEGVVHRDLKPDNVFLVENQGTEQVKLLDFGIARMSHEGGPRESLTQAGMVFGTPEYISPEQAMGEVADGRADLYAAGVMLFEMLAGRRPFHADSKVALISMHLTQPIPTFRSIDPSLSIPPPLERVVRRAMEKKRDLRYPTAFAFREDLQRAVDPSRPSRSMAAATRPTDRAMEIVRGSSHAIGRAFSTVAVRAERAGVPFPRTVVASGMALVAALTCILTFFALRRPSLPKPLPPPPASAADLERAESLLAHGDLPAARAALQQQLSAHPEQARVHFLLGNLHFAEKERAQALGDYRDALHLDPGYRGDPTLLANGRSMLDERATVDDALHLLADDIGAPALPRLTDCARTCRDLKTRRAAADAMVKLGGASLLPKEGISTDADLARLTSDLENGRTCKDRRRATNDLKDLGDPRAIDALRRAKDRKGGFLGVQRTNSCIARELDEAIRALGGTP
jgi:tRNA A-37 threonylcarbamoyl transferase component Bud32